MPLDAAPAARQMSTLTGLPAKRPGARRLIQEWLGSARNKLVDIVLSDPCRLQGAAPLRPVLVATLGYGHRALPAVRVERFVERRAE